MDQNSNGLINRTNRLFPSVAAASGAIGGPFFRGADYLYIGKALSVFRPAPWVSVFKNLDTESYLN